MSGWKCSIVMAVMVAAPGFAQTPDVESAIAEAKAQALAAQDRIGELGQALPDLSVAQKALADAAARAGVFADAKLLGLQFMQGAGPQPRPFPSPGVKTPAVRADRGYDTGTRALDAHRYDDAIRAFDQVIAAKSDRADGALYWKGYALNRLGRRDEATAAIAALRRDYPNSRWLNDAQALEVDVKQGAGQPVSPADESNEDLKLLAINSLMKADPERAIPLLEALLKGNSSPVVKDRALFVLTQDKSARARQVLLDFAKGAGNPDLQINAIRYLGMSGTADAQQQLAAVYSASTDHAVKIEIIRSLMVSRAKDPLFNLAKNEKDAGLRTEAIRQLGAMRANDQLAQLYASETSADNKMQIIRSMMVGGASDKLLELARSEKDPQVRGEAIRNLAVTPSTTSETMVTLYSSDTDAKTKREIVNGLLMRADAKGLIDLARKETDPAMKRYIVERLSTMHNNKEATDYMMELLK